MHYILFSHQVFSIARNKPLTQQAAKPTEFLSFKNVSTPPKQVHPHWKWNTALLFRFYLDSLNMSSWSKPVFLNSDSSLQVAFEQKTAETLILENSRGSKMKTWKFKRKQNSKRPKTRDLMYFYDYISIKRPEKAGCASVLSNCSFLMLLYHPVAHF